MWLIEHRSFCALYHNYDDLGVSPYWYEVSKLFYCPCERKEMGINHAAGTLSPRPSFDLQKKKTSPCAENKFRQQKLDDL